MLSNLRHISKFEQYKTVAIQAPNDFLYTYKYIAELMTILIPGLEHIEMCNAPLASYTSVPYLPCPEETPREQAWPHEAYTFLRERFLPHIQAYTRDSFPKRIYVSRRDALKRKVINEDELTNYLHSRGFETIVLENMGGIEQMAMFYNADMVVSTHGAALVNTMFCKKNTTVIELCSELQSSLKHFSHISECLGFTYHRYMNVIPDTDTIDANVYVNKEDMYLLGV